MSIEHAQMIEMEMVIGQEFKNANLDSFVIHLRLLITFTVINQSSSDYSILY